MDSEERLLTAARDGDVAGVRRALDAGADIEARDGDGRTALLIASALDLVDVATVLVSQGADVNALDDQHDTPWLVTGVTGSVAMLRALLPGGPDLRIVNRYGGVSVIPASERGHVGYVRAVLGTGIDVNHVNRLGWTALLECVLLGDGGPRHQEIARLLVDAGARVDLPDLDGVDALTHARNRGYFEIVEILTGADGGALGRARSDSADSKAD